MRYPPVSATIAIGKFEVLGSLGQGAGSAILKIRRASDSKIYALKVITVESSEDKKYITQAEREFEIGSQLDHKHLLKIHAFETTKKLFFVNGARLLLEYIDGVPMAKCPNLPIPKLIKIFCGVADGLTHMHRKGFFHADMKPDNIMVGPKGEVKVIDYGLVWQEGEQKDRVQGTLEFLAPEQAVKKIVNAKTDIFNFGATMHRSITGKPIPSQLREASMKKSDVFDGLVRPLRETNESVPPDLDALVRQCVKVRPDERPESMKEVRDRLRAMARAGT